MIDFEQACAIVRDSERPAKPRIIGGQESDLAYVVIVESEGLSDLDPDLGVRFVTKDEGRLLYLNPMDPLHAEALAAMRPLPR